MPKRFTPNWFALAALPGAMAFSYILGWWRGWAQAIEGYEEEREEAIHHLAKLHEVPREGDQ